MRIHVAGDRGDDVCVSAKGMELGEKGRDGVDFVEDVLAI